jgi:hypothetical protein
MLHAFTWSLSRRVLILALQSMCEVYQIYSRLSRNISDLSSLSINFWMFTNHGSFDDAAYSVGGRA